MANLIVTTYDWVPEFPHGHVRDIRACWALEEAGLPYTVRGVPFDARGAEQFAHQPSGPAVLGQREWLCDSFSIADIAMADVLRLIKRLGGLDAYPACCDYVGRATARPAFAKAYADQLAHFAVADKSRA